MPVRDVEWFGRPRAGLRVLANRGANGIDGVVSTAVGVALATSRPTAVLVGDVAFLHDSNALLGLARRPVDLAIVVVDNDGGGIFEFLPQAGALDRDRFEGLFGTPHGVDPGALAAVHGLGVHRLPAADPASVAAALADGAGRARLVHLRTDRVANVRGHGALHDAVAAALGAAQSAGRTASQ
jgi:2-succinyl-5-enolpyruvyl-6-hydroxy-3-cyclohexene-1-carboxylate synthase